MPISCLYHTQFQCSIVFKLHNSSLAHNGTMHADPLRRNPPPPHSRSPRPHRQQRQSTPQTGHGPHRRGIVHRVEQKSQQTQVPSLGQITPVPASEGRFHQSGRIVQRRQLSGTAAGTLRGHSARTGDGQRAARRTHECLPAVGGADSRGEVLRVLAGKGRKSPSYYLRPNTGAKRLKGKDRARGVDPGLRTTSELTIVV